MTNDASAGPPPDRHVSTGHLPPTPVVVDLVTEAFTRYRLVSEGIVSQVYPVLAQADPGLFGLSVVGVDGSAEEIGDATVPFTIMSVAKPFVFALVSQAVGFEHVRRIVGVNATGLPFNSVEAVDRDPSGRTNPMVNSGAIATTSLMPGATHEVRWAAIVDGLSRFAGRRLALDEAVLESASRTNLRNRAVAALLHSVGALPGDPSAATDLYTRQSCLSVTAHDLAVMGATLADGGVNPVTRERVVEPDIARVTLAVMTIAGLYETSGDWLLDVGMPGKSGIGGGIVTVSPGKGAFGTFSPPLDPAGNSVRGQLAARFLTRGLGLDILASEAAGVPPDEAMTQRPSFPESFRGVWSTCLPAIPPIPALPAASRARRAGSGRGRAAYRHVGVWNGWLDTACYGHGASTSEQRRIRCT
ncbi:MAG: glutaminase A [Intrasporangium sp.]|uniref:glutaminase A n=1 Tax=Intrasporangium sp. TaxID=1925024 RepID=UPI00264A45B7|nr:glutaminase A [Intrasporangium sp.]MDN5797980.1 glutaminase A [Intrasporangium sp.]